MHLGKRIGIIVLAGCGLMILANKPVSADAIRLNWPVDGPLLGGSLILAGVGEFVLPQLSPPWGPLSAPDISQVNGLDRATMFSFSHPLDLTSTILEYSTAGMPLAFALIFDSQDILPLGVVYVESIALALSMKNLLNYFIPRWRPYMYKGGAPGVDSTENDRSFPSGHTTTVFAAATAGVTLFAIYAPYSPYFIPFTVVSYGLAATTGVLRVLAGMHFTTDVIVGALIGSAFGYLVPTLHERVGSKPGEVGFHATVDAQGISLAYSY